jgi:hypothetical protein
VCQRLSDHLDRLRVVLRRRACRAVRPQRNECLGRAGVSTWSWSRSHGRRCPQGQPNHKTKYHKNETPPDSAASSSWMHTHTPVHVCQLGGVTRRYSIAEPTTTHTHTHTHTHTQPLVLTVSSATSAIPFPTITTVIVHERQLQIEISDSFAQSVTPPTHSRQATRVMRRAQWGQGWILSHRYLDIPEHYVG